MKLTAQDARTEKLQALYRARGKTGLILSRAANQSWLLGGRVQIGIAGDGCICTTVVNDRGVVVITNNIEGGRLAAEEFGGVPEIEVARWDDAAAAKKLLAEAAGEDPLLDTACEDALMPLRTVLLPEQQAEAEEVCRRTAAAITRAAFQVRPGMTEFEISGIVSKEAFSEGLIPNVLFTPADGHIARWRHALSTENRLEKLVMLSMGAQRNGMYCSITRFVCFGEPDTQTLEARRIAAVVAAGMYSLTRPGKSFGALFREIEDAYARAGAPEQVRLHHQGGLGGFQTRELRVDAGSRGVVQEGQLFAWNPSATGYKVEDMLLVGKDENRILTYTPEFPYSSFEYDGKTWQVPQILIL